MKSSTARKARIPPQKPTRVLKGHRGPVFTAIFTKDGQYLLSGGDDRTVQLWNPSTGLNIKKYQGHNREVLAIDCLPDNAQFVSCGGDKHATLWDVTTGEGIRSFRGHSTRINDIKYSPNVSVLVTGSNDRCVNVWDLRSRNTKPIQTMSEATDSITSLAVLDQEIISGSVDGVLRTYDLRKAKLLEDKADVPITSLKNSGDQRVLLVSFLDSAVRLMDKTSGKLLSTYTGHTNSRFQSRSSYYDGESCVMAGSEDGKVFVWDLLTSRLLWKANGHRGTITSVSSHPRVPCAVSASLDSTICVWESEE